MNAKLNTLVKLLSEREAVAQEIEKVQYADDPIMQVHLDHFNELSTRINRIEDEIAKGVY